MKKKGEGLVTPATPTPARRWVAVNTGCAPLRASGSGGKYAEEERREEDSLKHTTVAT